MRRVLFLLCVLFPIIIFCEETVTFGSVYNGIEAGARSISMGGSFVAVADDGSAAYWNPAGLYQLPYAMLITSFNARAESGLDLIEIAKSPNQIWGKQLTFITLASGKAALSWRPLAKLLIAIDTDTEKSRYQQDVNEYMLSLVGVQSPVSLGINVKYINGHLGVARIKKINWNIDPNSEPVVQLDSGHGVGFDLGIMYAPNEIFTAGLMIHNLWTRIYWQDPGFWLDNYGIPYLLKPKVRLGVASGIGKYLIVSTDIEREIIYSLNPPQPPFIMHAGFEVSIFGQGGKVRSDVKQPEISTNTVLDVLKGAGLSLVLRGGYHQEAFVDDPYRTYSMGVGINMGTYKIDFAVKGENLQYLKEGKAAFSYTASVSMVEWPVQKE